MRLPKDPENWNLHHFEEAVRVCWAAFDLYEDRVDFSDRARIVYRRRGIGYNSDDLYLSYLHREEEAKNIASQLGGDLNYWLRRNPLP